MKIYLGCFWNCNRYLETTVWNISYVKASADFIRTESECGIVLKISEFLLARTATKLSCIRKQKPWSPWQMSWRWIEDACEWRMLLFNASLRKDTVLFSSLMVYPNRRIRRRIQKSCSAEHYVSQPNLLIDRLVGCFWSVGLWWKSSLLGCRHIRELIAQLVRVLWAYLSLQVFGWVVFLVASYMRRLRSNYCLYHHVNQHDLVSDLEDLFMVRDGWSY